MSPTWLAVWIFFTAYVIVRAVMFFRKKRYGWGIALLFLALFVGYEATMQWREAGIGDTGAVVEVIEDTGAPPAAAYRDESEPRGPVEVGPMPSRETSSP